MKDIPHHIKKLNRRIIRSSLREEITLESELPPFQESQEEKRKMGKRRIREERLACLLYTSPSPRDS